ncbi:MAG: ribonuclease H family protein, partial [Propionicimonas sp.]
MSIQPTQYAGIAAVLNPTPDTLDRTYAWGMASTVSHLALSGFAPTLDDALFQAFSSAITAHPLDFLMVYCPDESFAGRLAEFNPYTNVRIAEWTINSHAGQLAKAGRYLAQDLLTEVNGPEVCPVVNLRGDTASLAPLTIATDGSHGRASSAWAWVSSDGHYRSGAGKSLNPLSAEVLAIREALKAAPKFRPVILLSDSKWAISHARRVQQDPQ